MVPWTPERRAAQAERMRKRWQDPDKRAEMIEAAKHKPGQASRLKMSESAKARCDDDFRDRVSARMTQTNLETWADPEKAAARAAAFSVALKARFSDLGAVPAHMRRFRKGWFARHGQELRERDGDLCQLCLGLIDFALPKTDPMSASVDHITPSALGGSDELGNLWLAHLRCNQSKNAWFIGRADGTFDIWRT